MDFLLLSDCRLVCDSYLAESEHNKVNIKLILIFISTHFNDVVHLFFVSDSYAMSCINVDKLYSDLIDT